MSRIASGVWIAARTRMTPPHRVHRKASTANTRASNCVQGSLRACGFSADSRRVERSPGAAESAGRLFAESRSSHGPGRSGTTLSRQPAAGARMPCYAERVIMRSRALITGEYVVGRPERAPHKIGPPGSPARGSAALW